MLRRSLSALGLLLLLAGLPLAAAGHYRATKLSWRKQEGTTAMFTLVSTWSTEFSPYKEQVSGGEIKLGDQIRVQGLGSPVLYFGDGAESFEIVVATVTAVDAVRKTWTGEAHISHEYATDNNNGVPWEAHFGGCCRDAGVSNRGDGYFLIKSNVDLSASYSPRLANLPRAEMLAQNNAASNSFYMAGYDDGPHPNRAPSGTRDLRYHDICQTDCKFTVAEATGLVSGLGGGGTPAGLYFLHVRVEDTVTGIYSEMDLEVNVVDAALSLPEYDVGLAQTRLPLPAVNELFVRYEYAFSVRFLLSGSTTGVSVQLSGSALPEGATVSGDGETERVTRAGVVGFESEVVWRPSDEQVGWTRVCVQALAHSAGNPTVGSRQHCLDFDVLNDPPPQWVSPTAASVVQVYMGEELVVPLRAQDDNLADDVNITGVDLPQNAVMSDLVKDNAVQINTVDRTFSWIPSERSGGSMGEFCFRTSDLLHPPEEAREGSDVCFQYRVPKCLYRVRQDQALVDIAEQFKCSWLQLWALNKDISRPEGYGVEGSINEGDIIHIGQLVLVKRGDTLEKIAARFGTTLRQIVALNADISPTEPLVTGQLVCLVPSSCTERTV